MSDCNQQANCSSPLPTVAIISYFMFNVVLVIAPFVMLQDDDSKPFWVMIITNMDILFLLVVTLSGNICAITFWLLIDVFHMLYFCCFSVILVTQFINEMGSNTGDNCSLFATTPENNDCRGLRTQFKSVLTVLMIAFVIIPVEVWLFISVNGFRHQKIVLRTNTESGNKENKDESFIGKNNREGKETFKPKNSEIQSITLDHGKTRKSSMDNSSSFDRIDVKAFHEPMRRSRSVQTNANSFLSGKEEQSSFKMSHEADKSSSTRQSLPSSVLSNYRAKVLPFLKVGK